MITKLLSQIKTFLQNNKYEIILVSALLGVAILSFLVARWLPGSKDYIQSDVQNIPPVEKKEIKGEDYSLIKQKEILKNQNDALIDSMARLLAAKPKEIKGVDRILTRVDTIYLPAEYKPATTTDDSTVIRRTDRYVDILAVGKPKGSYISFKLTPDTMSITKAYRSRLFRPDETILYIHHTNKYFQTTQGDSHIVPERGVLFNITGSVGYDFLNKRPYLGLGITPEFLRIPIRKRRK